MEYETAIRVDTVGMYEYRYKLEDDHAVPVVVMTPKIVNSLPTIRIPFEDIKNMVKEFNVGKVDIE